MTHLSTSRPLSLAANLATFRPAFQQQAAFYSDTSRFSVANAAIRTGKTYSAMRKFFWRVLRDASQRPREGKLYWLIAPTYEEGIAQKIELAQIVPSYGVDRLRQGTDERWLNVKQGGGKVCLKGNVLIEFKSAERPESLVARRVDGVGWTEIARSKYAAWPNVRGRLANTMGWMVCDTSPFGHSWFYNEILKPSYDGLLPDTRVHRWTAVDSPFIPRDEIESARASLPKAFFERDYMASDEVFMGQIYDIDTSIHIVEKCPFQPQFAVLAADVNTTSTHPAEFVWALGTRHGVTRLWVEGCYRKVIGLDYSLYARDILDHVVALRKRFADARLVIDPSFHTELKSKLRDSGLTPWNAVNDILPGVRTLGSALMPLPGIGPRITFAPACAPVVDQLRSQRWVSSADGVVKPQPDKTFDDGWADAMRYMAMDVMRDPGTVTQLR